MAKREENTPQTQETRNLEQGAFLAAGSSTTTYNPHLLRYLREKADLSQAELAKKLNTSVDTVAEWETGRRIPESKTPAGVRKVF